MKKRILLGFLSLFLVKQVSGYIDPGTGAAIASSSWGIIAGIFAAIGAFLVRVFINPIKRTFSHIWQKTKN